MATGVESFTSAGLGVYIHSESGKVGGPGMVAEDLINIMPNIDIDNISFFIFAPYYFIL